MVFEDYQHNKQIVEDRVLNQSNIDAAAVLNQSNIDAAAALNKANIDATAVQNELDIKNNAAQNDRLHNRNALVAIEKAQNKMSQQWITHTGQVIELNQRAAYYKGELQEKPTMP